MARGKNKDNLQRASRLQNHILDKYIKVRPQYKYLSLRIQRMNFLLDEAKHQELLDQAYDIFIMGSLAADLVNGLSVLLHIRDKLTDHGHELRQGTKNVTPSIEGLFKPFKTRKQVHPMCPIKSKIPQQTEFLQIVASQMETIALILWLEEKLLDQGKILEVLPKEHKIFKVNPMAEKKLNDMRMITVS